jgi:aldehyde:ferredoxin oxidoreductase
MLPGWNPRVPGTGSNSFNGAIMLFNVVEIDLASKEVNEHSYDGSPWIGGRGLATKLFYDRIDPGCDPLGPDNIVVIAASPLTGTIAPTAGRAHAVFKSPLTGVIGSSNSGGRWGKVFKGTGCDAVVIKGSAKNPVYISITDRGESLSERVKIQDASELWGKSVHEVTPVLSSRHGGNSCSVLAIGPAGENRVKYASFMNDLNRAFGRGGPGAVFGSKNLKAIVVNGSRKTEVAEPDKLKGIVEQTRHSMKAVPITKRVMRDLGTAGLVQLINTMEMLPHRNFQDCTHDHDVQEHASAVPSGARDTHGWEKRPAKGRSSRP